MIFIVFGAIGFVWAAAWFLWFCDDPAEHSRVSAAELALIQSGREPEVPHRLDLGGRGRVMTDRNMIVLVVDVFARRMVSISTSPGYRLI